MREESGFAVSLVTHAGVFLLQIGKRPLSETFLTQVDGDVVAFPLLVADGNVQGLEERRPGAEETGAPFPVLPRGRELRVCLQAVRFDEVAESRMTFMVSFRRGDRSPGSSSYPTDVSEPPVNAL